MDDMFFCLLRQKKLGSREVEFFSAACELEDTYQAFFRYSLIIALRRKAVCTSSTKKKKSWLRVFRLFESF